MGDALACTVEAAIGLDHPHAVIGDRAGVALRRGAARGSFEEQPHPAIADIGEHLQDFGVPERALIGKIQAAIVVLDLDKDAPPGGVRADFFVHGAGRVPDALSVKAAVGDVVIGQNDDLVVLCAGGVEHGWAFYWSMVSWGCFRGVLGSASSYMGPLFYRHGHLPVLRGMWEASGKFQIRVRNTGLNDGGKL